MTNKLKEIVEKGSEISGSISGAAIGLLIAGPIGAITGAAAGPVITEVFKKIGNEISNKLLGNREEIRVGATLAYSVEKLDQAINNGKNIRMDNFYHSENGHRSNAETLLEGTLLKSRNEFEEKKLRYYANFIANINLDSSISFERGNTLLRILERLSYRQIVILSYFNSERFLDTAKWMVSFTRIEALGQFQDFYSEIMDLYNSQLLQQPGDGISTGISGLKLSSLGVTICQLLELNDVDNEDLKRVYASIKSINELKEK